MSGKQKKRVMKSGDELAAEWENAASLRTAAKHKSFLDGLYVVGYRCRLLRL